MIPLPDFFNNNCVLCSLLKQVTNETAATVEDSAIRQPPRLKLPNFFSANCFSAERPKIESSELFCYQELTGHTDSIGSIEFSENGTHLISGSDDKTVRLWSIKVATNGTRLKWRQNTKTPLCVWPFPLTIDASSVAASTIRSSFTTLNRKQLVNNCILFHYIFNHYPNCICSLFKHFRKNLLNSVPHPDSVWDIALQPGSDGQVFASACEDGIVRLFDIRTSATGIFRQLNITIFICITL